MTDDRIVRMLRVSESDPVQQEAADEIERLTAERDAMRAQLDEACEALEPFGKLSDITLGSDVEVINGVYIGDLRRARAVLDKIKGGDRD